MRIEVLSRVHAVPYRALMLQAYGAEGHAFTSTRRERARLPLAWWEERIAGTVDDSLVLGAFEGSALLGVVGLRFETREKTRHRATLFGMVVREEARGRGLGRALVMSLLDRARAHPGTESVHLTVTQGNARAQGLYESCGFVRYAVDPLALRTSDGYLAKVYMACRLRGEVSAGGAAGEGRGG